MGADPRTAVVETIGLDACRVLQPGCCGIISAVFARSFYACFGDLWVCFGTIAIGNGPLNVVVRTEQRQGWLDGMMLGTRMELRSDGLLCVSHWRIELAGAEIWRPPASPAWTPSSLAAGLETLRGVIPAGMPEDGLACYIVEPASPESLAARAAEPAIQAIAAWVASPAPDPLEVPSRAIHRLLGLGPGLTPSGDDFLAGCLAALRTVGEDRRADALWHVIAHCGPQRTNPISFSHLRSAARGQVGECLHHVLGALLSSDVCGLGARLHCWPDLRHNSPWDAIAGGTTILRGVNRRTGRS